MNNFEQNHLTSADLRDVRRLTSHTKYIKLSPKKYLNTTNILYGGMRGKKGAEILEDGRIIWKNRKVSVKTGGIAVVALPAELKSWAGKFVEIECRSPREIVVRLAEGAEGAEEKQG